MTIRSLLSVIMLVANLATMPALAQPAQAPDAATDADAERTLEQNRRVALPYTLDAQPPAKEAQAPGGAQGAGLAMR